MEILSLAICYKRSSSIQQFCFKLVMVSPNNIEESNFAQRKVVLHVSVSIDYLISNALKYSSQVSIL